MLDAVLFDFDGVIRQWDEPELWTFEADAGFEIGTVHAVAFDHDVNRAVIRGDATFDEWRADTHDRLHAVHGDDITPLVDKYFSFEGRLDPVMVELLEALRGQVAVGLLTNNHDNFEGYLERVGLSGHFDMVANTHRLGVAKPESKRTQSTRNFEVDRTISHTKPSRRDFLAPRNLRRVSKSVPQSRQPSAVGSRASNRLHRRN